MKATMTDDDKIAAAIWSAAYASIRATAPIKDSTEARLAASVALLKAVRASLKSAGFKIVKREASDA